MITLHTKLSIEDIKKKLIDVQSRTDAKSLQLKLTSDDNNLKLRPTFLGSMILYPITKSTPAFTVANNPFILRDIIFTGHLIKTESGTTITGRFRYSYLFILFWPVLFGVGTYFLYVNSGQEYPWAPFITAIIGIGMTIAMMIEPRFGWDRTNTITLLKSLLGAE